MIRPYYDYSKPRRFALQRKLSAATKAIMAATAAVALVELLLWNVGRQGEGGTNFWQSVLFLTPGTAVGQGRWWQFVTYFVVQPAGGVFPLLSTLVILYFFGSDLERHIGASRYVAFYGACGLAAGVAGMLWPTVVMAGAEGPILGVAVAYALIWPDRPIRIFVQIKTKWVVLVLVGLPLLVEATGKAAAGAVPHVPELAGPVLATVVWAFTRFRTTAARPSAAGPADETAPAPPRKQQTEGVSERELDRILKKVHEHGIASLSRRERQMLNRASDQLRRRTRTGK